MTDSSMTTPAKHDPWIGRCLTKYAIVARLGQGGMGAVYLAQDIVLERKVALKLISPQLADDPKSVQRFMREARCAALLHHPNVVTIFDVDEAHGALFMAMEFVPGASAQQILSRDGGLPWRQAIAIAVDACRGLVAAHRTQVIHRDIKPANVLLSRTGEAKLADFGLAKAFRSHQASITQREHLIGTPQYMSPEQARGEDLDERSDIYSLGATLYALLTGEPPYPGKDSYGTMYAHATLPPPDPRQSNPETPAELSGTVVKAMAKQRRDRHASAEDLLRDLELILGSEREPLAPLAESFALPECDVLPLPATVPMRGTQNAAPRPRRVVSRGMVAGLAVVAIAVAVGVALFLSLRNRDADAAESLRRELVARNPKFDGRFAKLERRDGKIVALKLIVDDVDEIAPLRNHVDLEELELAGTEGKGHARFANVAPLAHLVKLKRLSIRACMVKNIEPLAQLHALEFLDLGGSEVDALTPLDGLPIKHLRLGAAKVRDLRGLERCPIEKLYLGWTYTLTSLEGLPAPSLRFLSIVSAGVKDLQPLKKATQLEYFNGAWAHFTHNYPKRAAKVESMSPADFEILSNLPNLATVGGEFTATEERRLRDLRPKLVILEKPTQVREDF